MIQRKITLAAAKKITRMCLVCGEKIAITVYSDGHYHTGHYFNRLNLPIKGTGSYKHIGTRKMFGKKINVVKWNGKEKVIEYWECNGCYQEALVEDWLETKIEKLYGKRCQKYEKNCVCCQAWNVYDTIIQENRGEL